MTTTKTKTITYGVLVRDDIDRALTDVARSSQGPSGFRLACWWGARGTGVVKHARCYLCDRKLDTWAAEWPRPKHVDAAVAEHRKTHLDLIDNVNRS